MGNKTSVDMFVKTFKVNSKAKDKTFEDFIKKHITTQYISYLEKCVYCDGIIKSSSYIKDGDKEIVKIDSSRRYLFFIMRLIQLYTDLDIKNENGYNPVDDYDKLNEVGAIEALIAAIPQSEYTEFSTLLDMKMDDFIENEYSIKAFAYNLKESLKISEDIINSVLADLQKKSEEK